MHSSDSVCPEDASSPASRIVAQNGGGAPVGLHGPCVRGRPGPAPQQAPARHLLPHGVEEAEATRRQQRAAPGQAAQGGSSTAACSAAAARCSPPPSGQPCAACPAAVFLAASGGARSAGAAVLACGWRGSGAGSTLGATGPPARRRQWHAALVVPAVPAPGAAAGGAAGQRQSPAAAAAQHPCWLQGAAWRWVQPRAALRDPHALCLAAQAHCATYPAAVYCRTTGWRSRRRCCRCGPPRRSRRLAAPSHCCTISCALTNKRRRLDSLSRCAAWPLARCPCCRR